MYIYEAVAAGVAVYAPAPCPPGWRKDVDFGIFLAHLSPDVVLDEEDDGTWPCSGKGCDGRVKADGDLCETCEADREYYAHDNDD